METSDPEPVLDPEPAPDRTPETVADPDPGTGTEAEPAPRPLPAATRSYVCTNHPEREGIGVCVVCRLVVCVECSTKIDGVNHCKRCLSARSAGAAERGPSRVASAFQTVLAVAVVAASVSATAALFTLVGEAQRGGAARR